MWNTSFSGIDHDFLLIWPIGETAKLKLYQQQCEENCYVRPTNSLTLWKKLNSEAL